VSAEGRLAPVRPWASTRPHPQRVALTSHRGSRAIQAVPGVGPVLAAVFVAEIGDVHRFASPAHLTSWAGLTPKHRESDTVVRRGPITKQGSTLVRWAAVEAAQGARNAGWLTDARTRIAARRGRNIATVAVARKLLALVYYGLRDGHIRALDQALPRVPPERR
jgi:transposase